VLVVRLMVAMGESPNAPRPEHPPKRAIAQSPTTVRRLMDNQPKSNPATGSRFVLAISRFLSGTNAFGAEAARAR